MEYYIFRLIAPRPTFVADMTPEERALMQAHVEYWRGLMAKGMVVIFGLVADQACPYGLGVVRLEAGVDPRSVWIDDPVIKAQKGFRFDVAPMLTAVVE
jgi:hypothetical protein